MNTSTTDQTTPGDSTAVGSSFALLQPRRVFTTGYPAGELTITCLGVFAVYQAQRRLSLPRSQKSDRLIKFLVLRNGHTASREELASSCWPNAEPAVAAKSLHTTVSVLRHSLAAVLDWRPAEPPIVCERGYYRFSRELQLSVDVTEFDANYQRGLGYERAGEMDACLMAYRAAVACYHGDLAIDDIADDWAIVERERLASTFLIVLSKLAACLLAIRQYEEAANCAHRVLSYDPCSEEAHGVLMRAFACMGQRGQALRQYDLCCSFLQRELGLEPHPDLLALRQQIMSGAPL